jgi:hypothetical protein
MITILTEISCASCYAWPAHNSTVPQSQVPQEDHSQHKDYNHNERNARFTQVNQSTPISNNNIVSKSISLSAIPCAFEPGSSIGSSP